MPGKRGFENVVVIGIPAYRDRSGKWHKRCADRDKFTKRHNVVFGNSVLPFDTRPSKDIVHFGQ